MLSTPSRTPDLAAIEEDTSAIERALDHIRRVAADKSMRAANATQAGATLAYDVARFLADPEAVGADALQAAYRLFMGRHSGSFSDSVMAAEPREGA